MASTQQEHEEMSVLIDDEIFNLRIVHDHFASSLVEDDDVDLAAYLEAYRELRK